MTGDRCQAHGWHLRWQTATATAPACCNLLSAPRSAVPHRSRARVEAMQAATLAGSRLVMSLVSGGCEAASAALRPWHQVAALPGVGATRDARPTSLQPKSCFARSTWFLLHSSPLSPTHCLYNPTPSQSCPLSTGLTLCSFTLSLSPIHS